MVQREPSEDLITEHNRHLASTMKIVHAIDLVVPNHTTECIGEMCKLDAIKALIAGKATAIQQEMAATLMCDELLSSMPHMIVPLAAIYTADQMKRRRGEEI